MKINTHKVKAFLPLVLAVAVMLFSSADIFAQKGKKKKPAPTMMHQKWEVGLLLGGSQYQGDLQKADLKEINLALGGLVRYHINDNFALRANFVSGRLSGYDSNYADRQKRAFAFKSPVRELSLLGEYDILGKKRYTNISEGKFNRTISPYLFGGLAFANITPETNFNEGVTNGDKIKIKEDRSVKVKKGFLAIPLGLGLKIDISKTWTVGVEAGFRWTFTDYLDGVSKAGNPDKKDSYAMGGLVLSYRIPFVKDTDGDGIGDDVDACPEVPGPIRSKGCPDKDADGVGDRFDNCPDVAGFKSMGGCPDTDRDGVADKDDLCPDVIGLKELSGCPDTDEDGIADKDDECPSEKGLKEYAGCPRRDTDGDGIEDKLDKCPKQKGPKENEGCPDTDRDGDGVVDREDVCPDVKGSERYEGCPDTDGDGIIDSKDKCPSLAGVSFLQGCPEIKQEDTQTLKEALYGTAFETGSAKIKTTSYSILDNVVEVMKKYPEYTLSIGGHTDNQGKEASNKKLSEARAKACYDYFVSKGIQAIRMSYVGNGSLVPVADNKTAAGRMQNRRVEFQLFVK